MMTLNKVLLHIPYIILFVFKFINFKLHILKDKQLIIETLLPCATHTAVTLMINSFGKSVNLTINFEYRK